MAAFANKFCLPCEFSQPIFIHKLPSFQSNRVIGNGRDFNWGGGGGRKCKFDASDLVAASIGIPNVQILTIIISVRIINFKFVEFKGNTSG